MLFMCPSARWMRIPGWGPLLWATLRPHAITGVFASPDVHHFVALSGGYAYLAEHDCAGEDDQA